MKVEDLKSLSSKIVAHAQVQKTEQYFQQFVSLLQQILRGNRQQALAQQKDQLIKSLLSFDEIPLSYSEKNLFNLLSYDTFVGRTAVDAIEAILHDEQFDPTGVLQKIEQKFNEFKQFLERNQALASALQRVPNLTDTRLRAGEALLEITFTEDATIENIVDFEQWIDRWTKIIRAFSQVTGEKPENSRVVFVQKSSPLIIDIATACVLVITLGKAVDAVLEKVERYLRIRKQVEEIRRLKLGNKEIEKALVKEAEEFSEKSSQEIAHKLAAAVKPTPTGEVTNGLSLAIKNLFVFIDKGGRVDSPSAVDDKQGKDMAALFKQIRELQQSIDQLRLPPPSSDNKLDSKGANT
jgi:hypothetical protein